MPLGKQLDEASKLQVGELLAQMAAGFSTQEQHPETAAMYQRGVETLALEFGLENIQAALDRFLTRQKFFPHPSEVREELEAMTKVIAEQRPKYQPDPTCDHITPGYQWVTDRDGDRAIGRCKCWLRFHGPVDQDRKSAAAGER